MTLSSMTGFARTSGKWREMIWTWELKAVNSRNLDVRCRLPSGFDALEAVVRRRMGDRLSRGNVSALLNVRSQAQQTVVQVNHDILDQLVELASSVGNVPGVAAARLDGLMQIQGVITVEEAELTEAEIAARNDALLAGLDTALERLVANRQEEGERLKDILVDRVQVVATLTADARACKAARPDAIKEKFEAKIADFTGYLENIDPARLAQEAALLATKADVREELDRLEAHVQAARDLLQADNAVGRRLDFLSQEFNREANTLCSKSSDAELTRIGLDLKATIDQFREQVQNIE